MPTVSYETDEGIFSFEQKDTVEVLKKLDSPDAIELIEFLESQTGDIKKVPLDKNFFLYAVLKFFEQGKGSVRCKACGKEYQAGKLRSFTLGAGESAFKVKTRWKRSLFKRAFSKPERLLLFGGTHEGLKLPSTLLPSI